MQTLNPDAGGARHPSRGVLHRNRSGTRNRALWLLRNHRGNNLNGLTLNQVARTQREVLHPALRVLESEEESTADAFSLHDLTHPAVNILNQQYGAAAPYAYSAPGGSCGRRLDPGHPSHRGVVGTQRILLWGGRGSRASRGGDRAGTVRQNNQTEP